MGPEYLSVSQLNTFLICPRKYRFRYIDHIEPERKAAAMAFGSAVHTTIEWWSRRRLEGSHPSLDRTLCIFRADWTAQTAPGGLTFDGKQTPESLQELGETLVGLFVTKFAHRTFSVVEERFEVPIIDHDTGEELAVPLVGYIDFIEDDGVVGEIKTAAKKVDPNGYQWLVQLSGYSYAWRQISGTEPRISVVELLKTKKPALEEFEISKSQREEGWFVKLAFEVYQAICNRSFFPVPSWACPKCEFKDACKRCNPLLGTT